MLTQRYGLKSNHSGDQPFAMIPWPATGGIRKELKSRLPAAAIGDATRLGISGISGHNPSSWDHFTCETRPAWGNRMPASHQQFALAQRSETSRFISMSLQPVLAGANLDDDGHVQFEGVLHLVLNQFANLRLLGLGDIKNQFVVDLEQEF